MAASQTLHELAEVLHAPGEQQKLPDLGYAKDALVPHIGAETLEYHHDKHHRKYVDRTRKLAKESGLAGKPLAEVIASASGALFNNAAQHFNHTFYWRCLSPGGGGEPKGALADEIRRCFGKFSDFRERFSTECKNLFGSGWCWLFKDEHNDLRIMQMSDAGCPLASGWTPLLTCDMWEHAYYIDYRNDKGSYVDAFWNIVDWDFVAGCLEGFPNP